MEQHASSVCVKVSMACSNEAHLSRDVVCDHFVVEQSLHWIDCQVSPAAGAPRMADTSAPSSWPWDACTIPTCNYVVQPCCVHHAQWTWRTGLAPHHTHTRSQSMAKMASATRSRVRTSPNFTRQVSYTTFKCEGAFNTSFVKSRNHPFLTLRPPQL